MVTDKGALEPIVAFLALLLLATAFTFAAILGVLARHEQAVTAADFAALATASTGDCEIGMRVAARNGARLMNCTLDDKGARVRVALPSGLSKTLIRAGAPSLLTATAHATT